MPEDYLKTLNPAQREAATHVDGPMLVLAGAGAGKTHTMITRLVHLINQGVHPSSILLLTFTNKAAEEMLERAIKYCGDDAKEVTACTYHSFCANMLRKYGKVIGVNHEFDIIVGPQETDALAFTKAQKGKTYALKGFPPNKVIITIFSAAVNLDVPIKKIVGSSKYRKYEKYLDKILELHHDYEVYKKERNLMNYDDLMLKFYKLLLESESVRKHLEKVYKYIIVDEYQDTNNLQSKILKALRQENHNLAVVGDDAQSIYKFRGANVQNIIEFPQEHSQTKVVNLTENYRSSNQILELANESYEKNATEGYPKRMHGQFDTSYLPVVVRPSNSQSQDEEVMKGIHDLLSKGLKPEDICVISRTSASLFGLEQLLTEANISYEKRGGMKFLEHEEILDMIAFLRFSANPVDELSLFKILQIHPGIGEAYARQICDLLGIVENPITNNKFKNYKFAGELVMLDRLMKKASALPNEELKSRYDLLEKYYLALSKRVIDIMDTDEGNRTELYVRLENKKKTLVEFKSLLSRYQSVTEFLDAILLDQSRMHEPDESSIVLTTIHSVKGLEFDTVFILNCVNGAFPRGFAWDADPEEEQEELRCFYVAVTRAKKRLYIMVPKYMLLYGTIPLDGEITRFLDDCEYTYTEAEEYISLD